MNSSSLHYNSFIFLGSSLPYNSSFCFVFFTLFCIYFFFSLQHGNCITVHIANVPKSLIGKESKCSASVRWEHRGERGKLLNYKVLDAAFVTLRLVSNLANLWWIKLGHTHIFSHQGHPPPPLLFPPINSGFNSQHFLGPVTVHISTIITCIKHFSNVALTCITWMLNMSIWKYTLGWRHFVWKGRDMIVILVGNQNYFLTYPQIFTKNLAMFIWNNDDIFIFLKENIKTWSIFWLLSLI